MNPLIIIPARGGSKGIPKKNIKQLNNKPLIYYSIEVARQICNDENICVSTDSIEIKDVVEKTGLKVPFLRPAEISGDNASTDDVIVHAINYYRSSGVKFDSVLLLQPTSPLRTVSQVIDCLKIYEPVDDMIVSVNQSQVAAVLREENENGYLEPIFTNNSSRRQDAKLLYEINGAIYVINPESIVNKKIREFTKVKKYIMPEINSVDIDTMDDWYYCEYLLKERL